MRLVAVSPEHFPAMLALNEQHVELLAPLTLVELAALHARASWARVAIDRDAVVGFALAFGSGTGQASVNFRWFAGRYDRFLYVDRIVVAAAAHRRGVGTLLYRELFEFARRAGYGRVTCELDADPPNVGSARFHDRFGFVEVGTQRVEYVPGKPKQVSLRCAVSC